MNNNNNSLIMNGVRLALVGFLTQGSHAAFTYNDLATDANGDFVSPSTSWSGPASEVVGPAGMSTSSLLMLQGISGGTLELGEANAFVGMNGLDPGVQGSMTIGLGGGTADLSVAAAFAGLGFGPNNFAFGNFANTDSLSVEFNWDAPISAATNNPAQAANAPFLGAFRTLGGTSNYDVTAEYIGLVHSSDGVNFSNGLAAGTTTINMSNSDLVWNDGAATFSGMDIPIGVGGADWQGINAFDVNGGAFVRGIQNNGIFEDEELVYATGIRFEISRTDGADFGVGEQFIFSTSGNQWNDSQEAAANVPPVSAIPETGSFAVILVTIIAASLHRKR